MNPHPTGFAQRRIAAILEGSGIVLNGDSRCDPQIHNPAFYRRVLTGGSLGLGESYTAGWWDCEQLDEFFNRLLRASISKHNYAAHLIPYLRLLLFNMQNRTRAFQVGEAHYDLGNDVYRAMLDSRMVYTCGYWLGVDSLDAAQQQKLKLVCEKLDLKAGMRVLDVGCGWGSFAKYAAENYGVEVVGVTVSKEQVALGNERCRGLPIELRLQDYRDVDEQFDAIASLGMFEHVGHKNHRIYLRTVQRCLKPNGRFLLHTIGKKGKQAGVDPWIAKYIFPNGEIPTLKRIVTALELPMVLEDLHNFGADYDKTLMAWANNFNQNWDTLKLNHPDRFRRLWSYYLKMCAGAFRARDLQLWQLVFTNRPGEGAYRRPLM